MKGYRRFKHLTLTCVLASLPLSHAIAIPVLLPATALPEKVGQAITQNQAAPEMPQLLPPIEQGTQASTPLGKEAEKITFKLNKIILKGNHVYSAQTLSKLYKDKLGKVISIAELYKIAESITTYYRNDGYILSRAILPPQHIKNGVVTIQIIEGYVDKVTVGGKPDGYRCIVQAYSDNIKKSRPLNIYDLEYYIILSNSLPGCSAKAVLTPSKTKVAAADVAVMTSTQRVRGYVSYDNYGTRYIGPQQATANIAASSLIASGDNLEITAAKAMRDKELNYVDWNYALPIFDQGWILKGGKTRTITHPMFVLEDIDVLGLDDLFYASLDIPIIRKRAETMTLSLGANVTDVDTTSFGEKLYIDHIRSLFATGSYGFTDKYYGNNLFILGVRKGLPAFGYSSDTNILTATTSRPGGHADYTSINAQASRLQQVKGNFFVYGIIRGQKAFNPLLATEQFVFGGPQLGRAYDPSELIGDNGLAGSLELRYNMMIERRFLNSIQWYAFYDAGVIWNINNILGQFKKDDATSTGAGARFVLNQYVSGNLMWTQPLTRPVLAEALIGRGFRPRVFFSVQANWS